MQQMPEPFRGARVTQAKQKQVLQGSKFGAPLCQVCQLDVWARCPEEWRRRVTDNERTAAQYHKLFGDAPSGRNKREKKRKRKEETGAGIGSGGGAGGGREEAVGERKKGRVQDVAGEVMVGLGISRGNGESAGGATGRAEGGHNKGKKGSGCKEGKGKTEAQQSNAWTVKGKVDTKGKKGKGATREGGGLKAKAKGTEAS